MQDSARAVKPVFVTGLPTECQRRDAHERGPISIEDFAKPEIENLVSKNPGAGSSQGGSG
jgi:hypothetical protein